MTSQSWTPKRAGMKCKRKVDAAIERLREVALEWADVDTGIEFECEALIGHLEEFRDEHLAETVEHHLARERGEVD